VLDKTNMAAMIVADVAAPPEGVRSYTLTVDTAVDDTDYVFKVTLDTTDVTFTVNSGTGATTSSIASDIRSALTNDTDNDGAGALGTFIGEGGGAGATAIIEGKQEGKFFTASEADANMSISAVSDAAFDTTEMEKSLNAIIGGSLAANLTADQNNYDPFTADKPETLLILTPDAAPRNITGIVPYHRALTIVNASTTNTIQLAHESGSSSAANQFSLPGGTSHLILAREAVVLIYDDINSKWRLVV
jgi:hypothetical protein